MRTVGNRGDLTNLGWFARCRLLYEAGGLLRVGVVYLCRNDLRNESTLDEEALCSQTSHWLHSMLRERRFGTEDFRFEMSWYP
jgi:hypothetical protein